MADNEFYISDISLRVMKACIYILKNDGKALQELLLNEFGLRAILFLFLPFFFFLLKKAFDVSIAQVLMGRLFTK